LVGALAFHMAEHGPWKPWFVFLIPHHHEPRGLPCSWTGSKLILNSWMKNRSRRSFGSW
jgi:hypothetical protein